MIFFRLNMASKVILNPDLVFAGTDNTSYVATFT